MCKKKCFVGRKIDGALTLEGLRIAQMVALGYSNEEISKKLFYSVSIVKSRMKQLYIRYDLQFSPVKTKRKELFNILSGKLYNKDPGWQFVRLPDTL